MKKVIIGLMALGSISAFGANHASLEYSCHLDGEVRTGKVAIDDQLIVGPSSCMFFGKGPTFCFRFERIIKINDIHLALRTAENLNGPLNTNFISLGNFPVAEGATSINTVKVGILKKEDLSCTYSNVNWKQ